MPKKKSGVKGASAPWYSKLLIPKSPPKAVFKDAIKAFEKEMRAKNVSQAEWADEFARQHKATIGAKKKPRTKLRQRPVATRSAVKKTTTKVSTTRRRRK